MKKLLLAVVAVTGGFAQQHLPVIQSPDVQSDGRVTFRYFDPDAHQVTIHLEGTKTPLAMDKNDQGVWSAATPVLAPEIYGYSFEADGMQRMDPMNSQIKPNLLSISNLVDVPGASPMPGSKRIFLMA